MSSDTVEKLLIVQEKDCRIVRIQKELHDIPARKAEIESRLDQHRQASGTAKDELKGRQAEIKQVELEIETRRQRITKLREQQIQLKTNKEFKAMDAEILGVQNEIRALEDRALELMEKLESTVSNIKRRDAELKAEESSVRQDIGALDQRVKEIEADLAQMMEERRAVADGVDPEWLAVYDRIFQNKGDKALVSVENGVCGGCHLKMPPYLRHDARKRTAIVTCEYCGRMLY